MSNLIRWEPMREMVTLREAMDRLFDDFSPAPSTTLTACTARPSTSIRPMTM